MLTPSSNHGRIPYVCRAHVDDRYLDGLLAAEIDGPSSNSGPCDYCEEGPPGAPLDVLGEVVASAARRYYSTAADACVPRDDGEWAFPTTDTYDVLADLDGVEFEVQEDIIGRYIEMEDWVPIHDPFPSPSERLQKGWVDFRTYVQHTSRFMLAPTDPPSEFEPMPDLSAEETLKATTEVIDRLDLVEELEVGSLIYRARTYVDDLPFVDVHQLASPPVGKASAGRMNGAGISVFYGALDPDTAAAEVYDGKDSVAIAEFQTVEPLTVVNLTRVPAPSVYDPSVTALDFERASFLRGFVREISRPIVRDGRIHTEYAPTQLFTEYLHWRLLPDPAEIQAVLYPSARAGGVNIVVFAGPPGSLDDEEFPEGVRRGPYERQLLRMRGHELETREYGPPATNAGRRRSIRRTST